MALMEFLNWKQKEPIETDKPSRYLSTHDILTGLYTRAYFKEEMAWLEREGEFPVSIVMADVHGQKAINDNKGHAAGNEMLRLTVLVLRNAFRVQDVVARIGKDGFAVLLPGTDNATVKEILKRIRYSVIAQNRAYAHLPLNLSLGAATAEKGDLLATTLKRAEWEMSLEREKGSFLANAQGENKADGGTLEEELRKHRDHPEELIEKRTEELKKANQQPQQNITKHKHAEEMLWNSAISYRRLFEGREVSMCGSKARIGEDTFGKPDTHC